jgi:IPTL-CTERM motif
MMTRLLILPLIVLSVLFLNINSQARVLVNDAGSNADIGVGTSAVVPTGSGKVGDYELIFCSISPVAVGAVYSDPTPGIWETLDTGDCGGVGQCVLGIWGRFIESPESEDIACNWDIDTGVFTAGSFRYNDVDPANPIIAVACNSGNSEMAVAPSVNIEAGSQVVRIFTSSTEIEFPQGAGHLSSNDEVSGSSSSFAISSQNLLTIDATTQLFLVDGPTGEASVDAGSDAEWRACTIAIRMAPGPTPIPTMSEWGFIAVAAFMGISGVWFLRRRQAAEA